MQMHIVDAEDLAWTSHRVYLCALPMAVYDDVPSTEPDLPIQHMFKHLKLYQLYRLTVAIIEWRKSGHFRKENFSRFMQEEFRHAENLQVEQKTIMHTKRDQIKCSRVIKPTKNTCKRHERISSSRKMDFGKKCRI